MSSRRKASAVAGRAPRLCVFARQPVLGQVKTRLAQTLGQEGALQAYKRLVNHCLRQLQDLDGVRRELWVAGDTADPTVQHWADKLGGAVYQQPPGDLGARMYSALFQPQSAAADQTIVIGTDCPVIDAGSLRSAYTALEQGADLVVAPAEDGGYGLIGMNTSVPKPLQQTPLQDIAWGTARVFEQTLDRAQALNLTLAQLPMVWDVDWPADWHRFVTQYGALPGP